MGNNGGESTARSTSTASSPLCARSLAKVTSSRSTVTVQPATANPRRAATSGPTSPGAVPGFAATNASMSRVGRSIVPSTSSAEPPANAKPRASGRPKSSRATSRWASLKPLTRQRAPQRGAPGPQAATRPPPSHGARPDLARPRTAGPHRPPPRCRPDDPPEGRSRRGGTCRCAPRGRRCGVGHSTRARVPVRIVEARPLARAARASKAPRRDAGPQSKTTPQGTRFGLRLQRRPTDSSRTRTTAHGGRPRRRPRLAEQPGPARQAQPALDPPLCGLIGASLQISQYVS